MRSRWRKKRRKKKKKDPGTWEIGLYNKRKHHERARGTEVVLGQATFFWRFGNVSACAIGTGYQAAKQIAPHGQITSTRVNRGSRVRSGQGFVLIGFFSIQPLKPFPHGSYPSFPAVSRAYSPDCGGANGCHEGEKTEEALANQQTGAQETELW